MGDFLENELPLKYWGYVICEKHIQDPDLKNFVRQKGRQYGECSLCDKSYTELKFDNPYSIDFPSLFKKIKNGIDDFFEKVDEILPYDSEENEWIGENWSTRELLT
jgi:hypothetical protein